MTVTVSRAGRQSWAARGRTGASAAAAGMGAHRSLPVAREGEQLLYIEEPQCCTRAGESWEKNKGAAALQALRITRTK